MANFGAGGSTPITRIINGDTLYFYFETNGIPLYQGVDKESGNIGPDWTTAANQPMISPKCTSAMGNTVKLSDFDWTYNGTAIAFPAADAGWVTSTNFDGTFQLNVEDGSLKIIKNVADKKNPSSDVLKCTCQATLGDQKFEQSKSVDILVQPVSASSYNAFLTATPANLDNNNQKAVISCLLMNGLNSMKQSDFTCKWYKSQDRQTVLGTGYTLNVTRADVNHIQLYICDFFLKNSTTACATAGILITDTADLYEVKHSFSGTLNENNTVTATGAVYNSKTNEIYAFKNGANPTWQTGIYAADASQSGGSIRTLIAPVASNIIKFTAAQIDQNGKKELHPYVYSEVTWTE